VNISNPSSPAVVGNFQTTDYASDLYIAGNYAYVVDGYRDWQGTRGHLYVVDISDPTNPIQAGVLSMLILPNAISVSGNYAYFSGTFYHQYTFDHYYLSIIDISDPATPAYVSSLGLSNSSRSLAVSGSYVYLTQQYRGGFLAIDVSDPGFPVLVETIAAPGDGHGIAISGGYIYMADWYSLMIFHRGAVGIDEPGPTGPYHFALKQNYPNPFNGQTVLTYSLEKKSTVSLLIYSITGQRVKSLAIGETQEPGEHRYIWDGMDKNGRAVSTGIYFYELYVDDYKESKAMILIK